MLRTFSGTLMKYFLKPLPMKQGLLSLVILMEPTTCCLAQSVNIKEFIEHASISYETMFTINTSLDMWNRMLDNPYLMGKLWEFYDFTPRYKVSMKGSAVHVIDPTGIEGDLYEIESGINTRIFYGKGKLKNWGIPISLLGKALFLLHYTSAENQVSVTLNIYGEGGDDMITNLILRAVSPILCMYINHRVTRNLRDLKIIIADIMHNPDRIRLSLSDEILHDFERLFN